MRKQAKNLSDREKIKTLDALYTTITAVRGREKTKRLLRDLLTESERIMLGRRILIAQLILSGATHRAIVSRLGVGMDTIARVHRWMRDEFPGFEKAIAGLEKEQLLRKDKAAYSFKALRRKFPQHFLLWTIAEEFSKTNKKTP